MANFEVFKEVSVCAHTYMLLLHLCIQVFKSHERNDGLLGDLCDGSIYKNHPLFSITTHTPETLSLQIVIYYDDVEINNPLGSRRGKHRSTFKAIQLIAVVTHPLLKEYGLAHILQPFINDMKKLKQV